MGGGPVGKRSGTVGKENHRSIVATVIDDDDDDCVMIEPMPRSSTTLVRDRPRLRGAWRVAMSRVCIATNELRVKPQCRNSNTFVILVYT